MGIQTISDNSVVTGSSASPVTDFLKNPPAKDVPPVADTPPVVTEAPLPDSPPTPPPQPTPSSSTTPFTEDDRNRIGAKLTAAIGRAFKSGDLTTEEQLREVSEDILLIIDKIHTQEELMTVLTALTEKWPFFSPLVKAETTQKQAVAGVQEAFKRRDTPPTTNT